MIDIAPLWDKINPKDAKALSEKLAVQNNVYKEWNRIYKEMTSVVKKPNAPIQYTPYVHAINDVKEKKKQNKQRAMSDKELQNALLKRIG